MLGDLLKVFVGAKQNKEANKINPVYTPYEVSPYAKQRLGMVQSLVGGRAFGAAANDRNIATTQANTMGAAGRNATDASQLLAVGAAAQGQANQASANGQQADQQQSLGLLDNLDRAYNGMTGELDKVYQDKMNKYGIDTQQKANLRSSGWNNIFGGIDGMEQSAIMAAQMMAGMPPTAGGAKAGGGGGMTGGIMGSGGRADMNSLAGSYWSHS